MSKIEKMEMPVLYKKTSTGAIQSWRCWTEDNKIFTEFGQVGGKLQTTMDEIREGKNEGRSNATTPIEQAVAEAKAYHEKKRTKNGYVEEIERAEQEETDIAGGVNVMLAHTYSKQGHKIKWGAYIQPKFDGTRMVAMVKNGHCSLWTRSRKPITSLPHIQHEIEKLFPEGKYIFDGEAYSDEYKNHFEEIVHYVRQEEPIKGCEIIDYHVYDLIEEGTFKERNEKLTELLAGKTKYLKLVETVWVENEDEAMEKFEAFRADGYEGGILRNSDGLYIGKRSYDLQKIKEFDEGEFDVRGISEGRGKLAGHAATFICVTEDGQEFGAKLVGDMDRLKEYFDDHTLWMGKKATVKFQGKTNKNAVPRFPIAMRIRDSEDY